VASEDRLCALLLHQAEPFIDLEDHLKSRLGTNVLVRMKSRERGQIVIEFRTAEEFERLSQTMRG